jgi:phosphoserine phosphatase
MESKKLIVIDFCGTLIRDSKSIERFIFYLIKNQNFLILKFYLIKILNLFIFFINYLLSTRINLISLFSLTIGLTKELISMKAQIYARYLKMNSRFDIIDEINKHTEKYESIIISGALCDYISHFINLIGLKVSMIFASQILYKNNISIGKVDIIYTGRNKLLPLQKYPTFSFISYGDSRYDLELFKVSDEVHLVYPKKQFKKSVIPQKLSKF